MGPLLAIAAVLVLSAGAVWAGSRGGATVADVPILAICAALSFGVQWVAFVPAYLQRNETFYDLTGTLTYLLVLTCALALRGDADARSLLLASLIAIWAVRLGSYLFARVRRDGFDRRFDRLKTSFARFLMTWTLQGAWVLLASLAALAAITGLERAPLGPVAVLGAGVWGIGFAIEVVADRQKAAFRSDPANRDAFIRSGLWARSRHPNYFGEIVLWIGIALIAWPVLSGWQWLAGLLSPAFTILLLTRVSGVPLLESRADRKWGDDPEYRAYKARTPRLVPRFLSPAR